MNSFLYYGDSTSIPNYNCSQFQKVDEPRIIPGIIDIAFGVFVIFLYIPSLYVFYKQSRIVCFKIMFLLGITDCGAITVNSVITGYLLIRGASFCDSPNFIYISGAIGLGFWCSACMTCLILVLNRTLDMVSPLLVKVYFRGYSTYFVLACPIIYGLFFTFCTPPILFSAQHRTWFFDPLIKKNMTLEYTNIPHTINNFGIVVLTTMLYVFFCLKVRKQFSKSSFRIKRTNRQRQIFIQSTLLCMFHLSASIVYVIMQFVTVPEWLTYFSQYLWQLAHGCPVIVYLFFNHKVRGALLLLFSTTSSYQEKSSLFIPMSIQANPPKSDELQPFNIKD
ncbi:unnamed protein product [Caenorhabditis angaria]|uniref:Uncharacterized protein n=1 Tax=Caenorhabditis angaria TaxID=860376 RepID=A0A9P1IVD8_9PELO|nr:unnamed protein product [Caenorhabditis angaria]